MSKLSEVACDLGRREPLSLCYASLMRRIGPNPFVPGRGVLPPYLAGREAEKCTLRRVEVPPVTFESAALARAIEASQCYPYFLQLVGAALWDVATTSGGRTINDDVVTRGARTFDRSRGTYYHHRRDELEREGLLDVASALARAFKGRDWMVQAEVDAAIAGTSPRSRRADDRAETIRIRENLAAVGYVWNPPGERDMWRPGIPSLMAHIEESATSRDALGRPDG